MFRRFLVLVAVCASLPCFAEDGLGNNCTIAGTWYGGSVVAYQLTIDRADPTGHYSFTFDPIYVNPQAPLMAKVTGELEKHGRFFEGSMLSLSSSSQAPGPNYQMPDLNVGWNSMQLVDCNTIKNTIPFFGVYFGAGIWQPGSPWTGPAWIRGKVPLADPPDVDMIPILTGEMKPIVEIYHRLPYTINRELLHH